VKKGKSDLQKFPGKGRIFQSFFTDLVILMKKDEKSFDFLLLFVRYSFII